MTLCYGIVLPVTRNMSHGDRALCRSWCLTIFNEADVGRLKSMPDVTALVVGEEHAPTTGKVHY